LYRSTEHKLVDLIKSTAEFNIIGIANVHKIGFEPNIVYWVRVQVNFQYQNWLLLEYDKTPLVSVFMLFPTTSNVNPTYIKLTPLDIKSIACRFGCTKGYYIKLTDYKSVARWWICVEYTGI